MAAGAERGIPLPRPRRKGGSVLKRTVCLLLAVCLCLSCALAGAQDYVSLPELRAQAAQGWHKTYQANGRKVVADADVVPLPDATTCPLVQVEGVGEEIDDALFDVYRQIRGCSIYNPPCAIDVEVIDERTVYPEGNHLRGEIWLDQDEVYLDGEVPPWPPENVDIDYAEFLERIDGDLNRLTGLTLDDFAVRQVSVIGMAYETVRKGGEARRGKQASIMGQYALEAVQYIHGLPILDTFGIGGAVPGGRLLYIYANPRYFCFEFICSKEVGVREEDLPLLSFDSFLEKLEALIDAGNLRGVDGLAFGTLACQEDGKWYLFPVWQVTGGFTQNPDEEQVLPYTGKDGGRVVPEAYNQHYFNAQTGEYIDGLACRRGDRAIPLPPYLTW